MRKIPVGDFEGYLTDTIDTLTGRSKEQLQAAMKYFQSLPGETADDRIRDGLTRIWPEELKTAGWYAPVLAVPIGTILLMHSLLLASLAVVASGFGLYHVGRRHLNSRAYHQRTQLQMLSQHLEAFRVLNA